MKYRKIGIRLGNTVFSIYNHGDRIKSFDFHNIRFQPPKFTHKRHDFSGRWLRKRLLWLTVSITHKDVYNEYSTRPTKADA